MSEPNASPRNTPVPTSPVPLAEGDMPEQDGSEDPQVGLQSLRDTALALQKEQSQSKGTAPEGIPPSPSTIEHLNIRQGIRGAATEADELKTNTVGVGEGATVNHLPDGGPR